MLAGDGGATALIDISDGFVADLVHVLDASGVGCDVDTDAIPIDPATNLAGEPVELGYGVTDMALANGVAWVSADIADELIRVEVATGEIERVPAEHVNGGVAIDERGVAMATVILTACGGEDRETAPRGWARDAASDTQPNDDAATPTEKREHVQR